MTGFAAREALRNLKQTDRPFWDELTRYDASKELPGEQEHVQEDEETDGEEDEDESNVSCDAVIEHVVCGKTPTGTLLTSSGKLASSALAESLDEVVDSGDGPAAASEVETEVEEEFGRGKRKRVKRDLARHNGEHFWKA